MDRPPEEPHTRRAYVRTFKAWEEYARSTGIHAAGTIPRSQSSESDTGSTGGTRIVMVNRVRASVAGAHPGEAVERALARYAGVTDAHLVPDDRPSLDAALLEARTLREVAPGSPARRALSAVAVQVDSMLTTVAQPAAVG